MKAQTGKANSASADVPSIVHDVVRSPGQPLDAGTRAYMEPRFGHDFSRVRIHADTKSAESARSVNALAYTVGSDIVFGAGAYSPSTYAGRQLVAHEMAHVVQQSNSSTPSASNLLQRFDDWNFGPLPPGWEPGTLTTGPRRTPTPAAPVMSVNDCSTDHAREVRTAAAAATAAIGRTVSAISQNPLPTNVSDALTTYFGASGPGNAATIAANLNTIAAGIPGATFECENPGSFMYNFFCDGTLAYVRSAASLFGVGSIHLCQPAFHDESGGRRMETIVHEGAHRFLNASDNGGAYYTSTCQQTAITRGLSDRNRRNNADSYGCLVQVLG